MDTIYPAMTSLAQLGCQGDQRPEVHKGPVLNERLLSVARRYVGKEPLMTQVAMRRRLLEDGWYTPDSLPSATTMGRVFQILRGNSARGTKRKAKDCDATPDWHTPRVTANLTDQQGTPPSDHSSPSDQSPGDQFPGDQFPSDQSPSDQSGVPSRCKRQTIAARQRAALEMFFLRSHYPDRADQERLSEYTGLGRETVKVWYCNRRSKWRKQQKSRGARDMVSGSRDRLDSVGDSSAQSSDHSWSSPDAPACRMAPSTGDYRPTPGSSLTPPPPTLSLPGPHQRDSRLLEIYTPPPPTLTLEGLSDNRNTELTACSYATHGQVSSEQEQHNAQVSPSQSDHQISPNQRQDCLQKSADTSPIQSYAQTSSAHISYARDLAQDEHAVPSMPYYHHQAATHSSTPARGLWEGASGSGSCVGSSLYNWYSSPVQHGLPSQTFQYNPYQSSVQSPWQHSYPAHAHTFRPWSDGGATLGADTSRPCYWQ